MYFTTFIPTFSVVTHGADKVLFQVNHTTHKTNTFRFIATALILLFTTAVIAQAPPVINYQGALRDAAGKPVANRDISVQLVLKQNGNIIITQELTPLRTNIGGIFSAQLNVQSVIDTLNWNAGLLTLDVNIDESGGHAYRLYGTQQLGSVPFSIMSRDVPSSYNGNVLQIGTNSYTLASPEGYVAGEGMSVQGNTLTNAAPDQTVTISQGNSNITISGTYPDFSLSVTPTLSLNNSELSISGGNTVSIAPPLSITGSTLTVGPPTNTIQLPVAGSPSIQGSGIANVTPLNGNSFTVDVPAPVFTGAGTTTVTGTYPGYTISSAAVSLNGTGATTVSGTHPNFTINSPSTSVTGAGAISVTGGFPNYVINTPSVIVTGSGASTVTGTFPNYVVNTASTSITGAGASSVTGNFPNYTITTPSTSITGSGASTVTGTFPNYVVNTASTSITGTGASSVTGTFPNYVINTATPSISGAGASSVTGNFPNYTITTPSTSITGSGASTVTGTFPNYVVNTASTSITGAGASTVTGNFPIYTITTPSTSITGSGASTVTGTFPNYVVNTASTTITGTGASSVTGTFPNYVINTATPSISGAGASSVTGNFPNYTITTPSTSITGSGASTVTGTFPNYVVNTASTSITGTGASSVTGTFPNYVINTATPSISGAGASSVTGNFPNYTITTPSTSITGSGASTVTGTFPNYVVDTPTPNISGAGASTVSGNYPNYIITTPSTSITGSGASTVTGTFPNYVVNTSSTAITGLGSATVSGSFPNYTINTGTLSVNPSGLATATVSGNTLSIDVPALTYTSATGILASGTNTTMVVPTLTITGNVIQSGPATNSIDIGAVSPWTKTSGTIALTSTAYVGIGTSTPTSLLEVDGGLSANPGVLVRDARDVVGAALPMHVMVNTTAQTWGTNTFGRALRLSHPTTSSAFDFGFLATGELFLSNINNYSPPNFVMSNTGRIGLGTANPTEHLQVQTGNNTQLSLISGALSTAEMWFGHSGNHFRGGLIYNNVNNSMSLWTNSTADRIFVSSTGNVGIRTNNPGANDMSIFNPGVNTQLRMNNAASANLGFVLASGAGGASVLNTENTPLFFGANNVNLMSVQPTGEVRIGSNTPVFGNTGLIVSRAGAFDNRLVITGGDNSNTYGGVVTLCENLNQGQGMAMRLDAGSNRLLFTSDPDGNFPVMGIGGYTGVPPGLAIGTGYATSNSPVNGLIVEGNTGIGTLAPAAKLDVIGSIKISDGSEGPGRVLISDAVGTGSWQPFSNIGWVLGGNAGTNSGLDFIGTTDAANLVIRTNGVNRMEFSSAGTNVGLNTAPLTNYNFYTFRFNGDFGPNRAGIASYRFGNSGNQPGGTDWSQIGADAAIKGSNDWGNNFSAGVIGHGVNDFGNSAAVIGAEWSGTYWGALAYRDAGMNDFAGYFEGNVHVNGTLSKSAGTFRIDHPLDPQNKFLIHSFVESPDMMNVYNGNVTTDANGMANVELPSYFGALNIDYKYQLTVIGQFAQAIVLEEVNNNHFTIQTDKPNVKVSWQVTGVRNDEYAKRHRVVPELPKNEHERGTYLQPELFGLPVNGSSPVEVKPASRGGGR